MAAVSGRVMIYGGKGALGSACVSFFKAQNWVEIEGENRGLEGSVFLILVIIAIAVAPRPGFFFRQKKYKMWVGSIDMSNNDEAHANVVVKAKDSWLEQEADVLSGVESVLSGEKLDALICVAGGWAGGSASSKDLIKNSDLMWKQSVWTSVITAGLASKHLKEGGFVSLTGAKAALEGTPGMIGYGLAKAAVHQLVQSLAAPKSGLPKDSLAVAILPVTLDTPMNRKFMPNADHSTWTPLQFVAELLHNWASGEDRPDNGSLVQLITTSGKTELVFA